MAWVMEHASAILGLLLAISEIAGVIFVMAGRGVPGIISGIIQALKAMGAKKPELPAE